MICLQCEMMAQQIGVETLYSIHTSKSFLFQLGVLFLYTRQRSGSEPNLLLRAVRHSVRQHCTYTVGLGMGNIRNNW